jgi:LPS sulfotransferase NodH
MTPYVIVGMPRTGSTLLATGLAQHPDIAYSGELFHPVTNERQYTHHLTIDGKTVFFDPLEDDAITFLQENLYSRSAASYTAVGFKLFGDYVKGPGSERLFMRLKDEIEGLRVIHIKRDNYLDTLVSRELAKITKKWVVFADQDQAPKPRGRRVSTKVTISIEMAERFFKAIADVDGFYARHFGGDAYRCVTYDALDRNFVGETSDLFAFLGASPMTAEPKTLRQKSVSNPSMVTNFKELKSHFKGTPYAVFF